MPNWASDSLSDDPTVSLNKFQNDLTVSLISTPRASLKTCASDEKMDVVAARNRADAFDFLPVTEPEDARRTGASIVGLIEMTHVNPDKNPVGIVRDYMVPLSEQNLIGSDASILRFLLEADRHRCRLVVSATEISGLVSISDLQKLPVRAALFAMITHLEMIMADNIRRGLDEAAFKQP
jgi:CBS domain-containing protein